MPHVHEGQCDCGETRYRLHDLPLIVHACHCRACQRQTGSTNVVNYLIEKHKVELLSGNIIERESKTPSGSGQMITRCANCMTVVWSEYLIFAKLRDAPTLFIRAGTLDRPELFPPDVHIFAETKQPHLKIGEASEVYSKFYNIPDVWTPRSLARLGAMQEINSSLKEPSEIRP